MIEILIFIFLLLVIERIFHGSTFGFKHGRASFVDNLPEQKGFFSSNARGVAKDAKDLRAQVRENVYNYYHHTDIFSGHVWEVRDRK